MSPARRPPPPPSHREVLEDLASRGILEEWRLHPAQPAGALATGQAEEVSLTGCLTLNGHRIRLRVTLPWSFPHNLPLINLEAIEPHLELPHVVRDRQLCYEAGANLLDRHAPHAIAYEALLRARAMLDGMLSGSRAQEFAQELVASWRVKAQSIIPCIVEPGEYPRRVMALYLRNGALCAVADEPQVFIKRLPEPAAAFLRSEPGIYTPLDPASADPNFEPGELQTLAGLRKYVRALPEQHRLQLEKLLKQQSRADALMVLGVQRPRGGRVLVGVHLEQLRGGHPLARTDATAHVVPIELLRQDHAFLAPRGGASVGLKKRRVLLAGCGAVGGHIALALARAGVGRLSLLDHDNFEFANTYRHVCGQAWVGKPKVLGLQRELERLTPYIEVTPHKEWLENFLMNGPTRLREYDLVISALGSPTMELHLNEQLWSDPGLPPALFAWVEPLSLGGHVLLTHVKGAEGPVHGCLECLHLRPIEGGPLENQAAFASPGVTYTQDMLGCGNQHMPFADLDAQRTAELTVRLALRVLQGDAQESPLLSWKGDRRAFEQAGYTVTPRYELEPSQLEAQQLHYRREDCGVCGAGG